MTLNKCDDPGPFQHDPRVDPIPPYCPVDERHDPSLEDVAAADFSWMLDELSNQKTGYGESALCDPMQAGHIINEQGMSPPNRDTVYRYAKSLRGTHEAMKALFSDIVVLDEAGKAHNIPIIWGSQEKAVAAVLQENVRKDESLVVDRIPLPMLAIYQTGIDYNRERYIYHQAIDYLRSHKRNFKPGFTVQEKFVPRDTIFGITRGIPMDIEYTLYAWSLYEEDMLQIATQVITKFSPIAYIRVRGVNWEIGVKPGTIRNNVNLEPGDKQLRVIKWEFPMTAETFVLQPIQRRKAVLSTNITVADATDSGVITDILERLEDAIEELQE